MLGEEGGIQGEKFWKKCKRHKYHPKIILHTNFYLYRTMGKYSKPGGKIRGEKGWNSGRRGIKKIFQTSQIPSE